jgi:hypothetical protein
MMRPKRTAEVPTTPCWIWSRALDGKGYGAVWRDGRIIGAHRYVYEALMRPIPKGLQLDHLCRTPACVNPDHLEPVTQTENIRRSPSKPLSLEAAAAIRAEYAAGGISLRAIGLKYGVSDEAIRLVVHHQTWRDAA